MSMTTKRLFCFILILSSFGFVSNAGAKTIQDPPIADRLKILGEQLQSWVKDKEELSKRLHNDLPESARRFYGRQQDDIIAKIQRISDEFQRIKTEVVEPEAKKQMERIVSLLNEVVVADAQKTREKILGAKEEAQNFVDQRTTPEAVDNAIKEVKTIAEKAQQQLRDASAKIGIKGN